MSKGYIGITLEEWLMYLKENNINREVNFWRKETKKFNDLEVGEPFFFLVKNDKGIKSKRMVLGYGIYKRYEILDINEAWDKYKDRNGAVSKDNYLSLMKKQLKNDSTKMGCIILDNIQYFDKPVKINQLDIEFNNKVVSGKKITHKEVDLITSGKSYSFPIRFDSWQLLNENIALKTLDKSAFFHNGSGIPIETRDFFEIDKLSFGDRKDIKLIYNETSYDAHFEFEDQKTARTRLIWGASFKEVLKKELPEYYELLKNKQEFSALNLPQIRVEKIDEYNFNLDLISFDQKSSEYDNNELDNINEIVDEIPIAATIPVWKGEKLEKKFVPSAGTGKSKPKRDAQVAANALIIANYLCEYDRNDKVFLRKNGVTNYTEPHHLIPMSNHKDFDFNLDVEENIVSLCSHCHNLLHYGRMEDKEPILRKLYDERKEALVKVGLELESFEDLKKYYI